MPRGGKRENAGRKPTGQNPKRVSLHLSVQPEQAELIKKAAEKKGETVSAFVLSAVFEKII